MIGVAPRENDHSLLVALINTLVNFVRSNYASTPTYLKSHHYLVYVFNR